MIEDDRKRFSDHFLSTAVIVSLRDFIEEMDLVTDEATAYINRQTGELITLTHEEAALTEDPEEAAEAPQWQKDLLPKAREVMASEDYIPLPSKFEIHEWSIMERFARSLTDAAVSDELDAALRTGSFSPIQRFRAPAGDCRCVVSVSRRRIRGDCH